MDSVVNRKAQLRQEIRAALKKMSDAELVQRSRQACQQLAQTPEFDRARTVMLFLSLPAEVVTDVLVQEAFSRDKRVVVPLVVYETRQIVPVQLHDLHEHMQTDKYGLRSPDQSKMIPVAQVDLVVVPGLAFDRFGHRLGRGGGFYDRFLHPENYAGPNCGLALHDQIVPAVPINDHDQGLMMLATDAEVLRFEEEKMTVD